MQKKAELFHKMLSFTLSAAIIPASAVSVSAAASYMDGSYEGTGAGRNGDITLSVTITDGIISGIETIAQEETPGYWEQAAALYDTIIENNSTEVDAVSGATISSNGIKAAVNDALSRAVDPGIFNSGDGSEKNPYVIATAQQLSAFAESVDKGETYSGQYIELGDSLDISGIEWDPIGAEGTSGSNLDYLFAGSFDGNGCTISGLTISGEYSTETNAGLFSTLANTAVVKNLNVTGVDINVSGESAVVRAGAVAGDSVSASGAIGLRIDNCTSSGTVNVTTSGNKMGFGGGIIGRAMAYTAITNCGANTAITVNAGKAISYAGGIAGMSGANGVIANCYSLGNLYAASPENTNFGGMAGGITAMQPGKQWNCYASGNVTVANGGVANHKWIGVLDGQLTTSGMTKEADGIYRYPSEGALRAYGYYPSDAVLTVETWSDAETLDNEAAIDTAGAGSSTVTVTDGQYSFEAVSDVSSEELVQQLNSNLYNVEKLIKAYGIEGIQLYKWEFNGDNIAALSSEVFVNDVIDDSIFAGGNGTAANPYLIETAAQLKAFAASLSEGIDYADTFILLNSDIDISGENWMPVGGSEYLFNGTFDGQEYTISGLTEGSESEALALTEDNIYIGLFGALGENAVVKNVNLTSIAINVSYIASVYAGGIAGAMSGSPLNDVYTGAVIDNCSVSGKITLTSEKGNNFAGGITAYQYKGAVINSKADVDVSCTVTNDGTIAESGGLVGLNNRGLVANCSSVGDIYGSSVRSLEGMASVSSLISVNAGALVNCYADGANTTDDYSTYVGTVSGWVTGIGKSYSCWYNSGSLMQIGTQIVNPVESIGTKVSSGVNEDGDSYIGGLVDDINSYDAITYSGIAEKLNAKFDAFPIDITIFGLTANALRSWEYDSESNIVDFADTYAAVTYSKPDVENVQKEEKTLKDGVWYGRDAEKSTVAEITIENGTVTKTEVISGSESGDAYDEALDKAKEKAVYGDTTNYAAADTSKFAGGSGTEADPYLISNEEQLRYVAEAINEDVSWENVWFALDSDITLTGGDWLPIGWGIKPEINGAAKLYCAYPFCGNFDGRNHTVSGMTIGSKAEPADAYTAAFFGITSGEHITNDAVDDGVRIVNIRNLMLENISINTSTRYETYTAGLIGSGQNGIYVDNCGVTGDISVTTSESFARAGGLIANALRGCITDSYTDVNIYAETDSSNVYAGGLFALTNRVTVVNCYALGNVTADSSSNNKVHIGGLTGQAGGIQINCYAHGDIVSKKTTTDVGGINGRLAGIAVDYNCYYNSDAALIVADTPLEENIASGVNADKTGVNNVTYAKTAAEMAGEDFAQLLNDNRNNMSAITAEIPEILAAVSSSTALTHTLYYSKDGSDLNKWVSSGNAAVFETVENFIDVIGMYADSLIVEKLDGSNGSVVFKVTSVDSEVKPDLVLYKAEYDSSALKGVSKYIEEWNEGTVSFIIEKPSEGDYKLMLWADGMTPVINALGSELFD